MSKVSKRFQKILLIFTLMVFFCLNHEGVLVGGSSAQSDEMNLARQAVSILQNHCLQCHGQDRMSDLDLRTRESMLKGGTRGTAIKPGDGLSSLLYRFVSGEASPRMPLGEKLEAGKIDILKRWIDAGALWPEGLSAENPPARNKTAPRRFTDEQRNYWAFRQIVSPSIPSVRNKSWVRNPIDSFILAKLEDKGLAPSPAADRQTLLRRVTFDLTGLPPTPEEIKEFLADKSPGAYEKVVKRLLDSPRYGERWAQHWLDVVRFGETNGFELDQDREQSWRYRDYVVKSINDDKPYDRFIVEQIAGDELDPDSFEMRVATGFLRAGPQHVVAGNQDLEVNRQEWLTEVMHGVSSGIMGLTVGCARCHDHKFDPILQADFYRLQAFFSTSDIADYKRPSKEQQDAYNAAMSAHREKLKPILDQISRIEKPYKDRLAAEKKAKLEPHFAAALAKPDKDRTEDEKLLAKDAQRMLSVNWDELLATLNPTDKESRAVLRRRMHEIELYAPEPLPKALSVSDVISPAPSMHILKGGDPHRPGDVVMPGFLTVLLPADSDSDAVVQSVILKGQDGQEVKSPGRRLALARWLTDPANPLTSRVMVNRLWHYHFGRGIVATPNDLGRNGRPPTHPELLDWLAAEFIARGYSLKQMHQLMVLSNAYRQSSEPDPIKVKIDPDNQLFWRMNRRRLDAEAIRDAVIFATGKLTEQTGGPPVRVPLEPEVYDTIFTEFEPDNLWPIHPDPRQHLRRSLYLLRKRNVRLPLLVAFDSPDLMSSCGARSASIHSLQALTLMNSDFMFQQSRALAARLINESGGSERLMIDRLYLLTLGRRPAAEEIRLTQDFLKKQKTLIGQRKSRGEAIAELEGLRIPFDALAAAAWVDLCLSTMNLNESVYLR